MANERKCDGCTKCCEGWLSGSALGHDFWPGRPCPLLAIRKGCSVYQTRPNDPCKSYKCQWLVDPDIPLWMKPSEINAIITWREINGVGYIDVTEAGEDLRAEVLSWLVMDAIKRGFNLQYSLKGGFNKIGSPQFLATKTNSPQIPAAQKEKKS